jgi:hypothetical protein
MPSSSRLSAGPVAPAEETLPDRRDRSGSFWGGDGPGLALPAFSGYSVASHQTRPAPHGAGTDYLRGSLAARAGAPPGPEARSERLGPDPATLFYERHGGHGRCRADTPRPSPRCRGPLREGRSPRPVAASQQLQLNHGRDLGRRVRQRRLDSCVRDGSHRLIAGASMDDMNSTTNEIADTYVITRHHT